jgi:hypothetical protein
MIILHTQEVHYNEVKSMLIFKTDPNEKTPNHTSSNSYGLMMNYIGKMSLGIGNTLRRHPPDDERFISSVYNSSTVSAYIIGILDEKYILVSEDGTIFRCPWNNSDSVYIFGDIAPNEYEAVCKLLLHETHKTLKFHHFFWKLQYDKQIAPLL